MGNDVSSRFRELQALSQCKFSSAQLFIYLSVRLLGFRAQKQGKETMEKLFRRAIVAVAMAVLIVILSAQSVDGAANCDAVYYGLLPCATFTSGNQKKPTQGCCTGAKTLNSLAKNPVDRQFMCRCFVNAGGIIGIDLTKAVQLYTLCPLSHKLPVSVSGNCTADGL